MSTFVIDWLGTRIATTDHLPMQGNDYLAQSDIFTPIADRIGDKDHFAATRADQHHFGKPKTPDSNGNGYTTGMDPSCFDFEEALTAAPNSWSIYSWPSESRSLCAHPPCELDVFRAHDGSKSMNARHVRAFHKHDHVVLRRSL